MTTKDRLLYLNNKQLQALKILIWEMGDNMTEEEYMKEFPSLFRKVEKEEYNLYEDVYDWEDYARELVDLDDLVPDWIKDYIDYKKLGTTLSTEGNDIVSPYGTLSWR